MPSRICIYTLFFINFTIFINAEFTIETSHSPIQSNLSWNFLPMAYSPINNVQPIINNFYPPAEHQLFNNCQFNSLNHRSTNFSGYKKSQSTELIIYSNTPLRNYPAYSWSGTPAGISFQLPSYLPFTQAWQQWSSLRQKIVRQYLPPGYVPLVAKINPPSGYKSKNYY